jgi:hypothetical protein
MVPIGLSVNGSASVGRPAGQIDCESLAADPIDRVSIARSRSGSPIFVIFLIFVNIKVGNSDVLRRKEEPEAGLLSVEGCLLSVDVGTLSVEMRQVDKPVHP